MKSKEKPTRTFDVAMMRAARGTRRPCFRYGESKLSASDYLSGARRVGRALIAGGLKRGEAVGIISDNRPEWNIIDIGVMLAGGVLLPLSKGLSAEEYVECIGQAGVRFLFVEDEALLSRFRILLPQMDTVTTVVVMAGETEAMTLETFCSTLGKGSDDGMLDRRSNMVTADDVCMLVYTGGGTYSKLTHRVFLREVADIAATVEGKRHVPQENSALSTRYGRSRNYAYQMAGRTVSYPVKD